MKRLATPLAILALVAGAAVPALGYLKLGTRVQGRIIQLEWDRFPVRYFVTDRSVGGVSAQQFQAAISRAFTTWNAVGTAETSAQFAGFTQAPPFEDEGMTVIGYANRPDLERTLAVTTWVTDDTTGRILESDILFNSAFPWSVAQNGESGRFDVESIAVHEIGHLHGLGHSALGETELQASGRRVIAAQSVLFPIAFSPGNIADRTLKADDVAGISDIYPTTEFTRDTGSISGTVTKNGRGLFGAHVSAFNPKTGKLIASFTLNEQGAFTIAGLDPGPHVVRVEPLDDGDLESFLEATIPIDLDFRVKFHDRLVVVPRGGGTRDVNIAVVPK